MADDPDMNGEDPQPEIAAQRCHHLEPRALLGRADSAHGPRERCTFAADHDGPCSWDDDGEGGCVHRLGELKCARHVGHVGAHYCGDVEWPRRPASSRHPSAH